MTDKEIPREFGAGPQPYDQATSGEWDLAYERLSRRGRREIDARVRSSGLSREEVMKGLAKDAWAFYGKSKNVQKERGSRKKKRRGGGGGRLGGGRR